MASKTETHIQFVRAARVEEVPPGTAKTVRVGDCNVVLANWEGNLYAFGALCPHRQNSLDGAKVWDGMLECPWHHFRYSLQTGENLYPRNVYPGGDPRLLEQLHPLHCYPVRMLDGDIFIALPERSGSEGEPA